MKTRQFVCYFHFIEWYLISLGISIDFKSPNLEIHLPFGFIRVGWIEVYNCRPCNLEDVEWRNIGLTERYK